MPRIRGYVTTAATTEAAVNKTTVTEQTSNAQRSLKSSNAADAAAGTGARTVKVTYYSLVAGVVAGPHTETVTLSGVTAVPTVATDICFIEKMEVLTAGSGGVPAGVVTLYSDNAGVGTAVSSIAAGDLRTYLGHHYVPSGLTCHVSDAVLISGAGLTQLPKFAVRSLSYAIANSAEADVNSNFVIKGSQGFQQVAPVPLQVSGPLPLLVAGPARVQFYVTPSDNASQLQTVDAGYLDV